LDAARRGDPSRAVRSIRRARRGVPARPGERYLLPDRHADADRSRGEKRDSDSGVRADEASRGHAADGRRGRRRALALPPDYHDLVGADVRRAAARDQLGRRGCEPALARHERDRRHARGHLHSDAVRAAVLPLDRGLERTTRRTRRRDATAGGERLTGSNEGRRIEMRRVCVLLLSISLAGCIVTRVDPGPRPQSLPDELPAQSAGAVSLPDPWWELFDDETLDELIDEALAHNPDVAIAAARVEQARSTLRIANADR